MGRTPNDTRADVFDAIAERSRAQLAAARTHVEDGTCDACCTPGYVVATDGDVPRLCVLCALAVAGTDGYLAGVEHGALATRMLADSSWDTARDVGAHVGAYL